jgi:hypothetical protein
MSQTTEPKEPSLQDFAKRVASSQSAAEALAWIHGALKGLGVFINGRVFVEELLLAYRHERGITMVFRSGVTLSLSEDPVTRRVRASVSTGPREV